VNVKDHHSWMFCPPWMLMAVFSARVCPLNTIQYNTHTRSSTVGLRVTTTPRGLSTSCPPSSPFSVLLMHMGRTQTESITHAHGEDPAGVYLPGYEDTESVKKTVTEATAEFELRKERNTSQNVVAKCSQHSWLDLCINTTHTFICGCRGTE
jgi:hypothetical protein